MSGFTPPPLLSRLFACLARLRLAVTEPGILREDHVRNDRLEAFLWLSHILQGLDSLIARLRKGPLPPLRRHSTPSQTQPSAPAPTADRALLPLSLPRQRAWLAQALPTSADLALLRTYLAHPELQPLFAREPTRFARLLRPLCRAAGCPLPPALIPPQPAAQTPEAEPPPPPQAAPAGLIAPPPSKPSLRTSLLTTARLDLVPFPPLLPKTA